MSAERESPHRPVGPLYSGEFVWGVRPHQMVGVSSAASAISGSEIGGASRFGSPSSTEKSEPRLFALPRSASVARALCWLKARVQLLDIDYFFALAGHRPVGIDRDTSNAQAETSVRL